MTLHFVVLLICVLLLRELFWFDIIPTWVLLRDRQQLFQISVRNYFTLILSSELMKRKKHLTCCVVH